MCSVVYDGDAGCPQCVPDINDINDDDVMDFRVPPLEPEERNSGKVTRFVGSKKKEKMSGGAPDAAPPPAPVEVTEAPVDATFCAVGADPGTEPAAEAAATPLQSFFCCTPVLR